MFYDDSFYVGEVVHVISDILAVVKFLKQSSENIFRWPGVEDIADVEAKYLLSGDLDVNMCANGRSLYIKNAPDFENLWLEYKELFAH